MMLIPNDILKIMEELEMEIQPFLNSSDEQIIEDYDLMWRRLKERIEKIRVLR